MGTVHYEVSSNVASAIDALIKLEAQQGKVRDGLKDITKHSKDGRGALEEFGTSATHMVAVFASFEGIKEIFTGIAEQIAHARGELHKFSDDAKGGATMGAMDNLPGFRERTLALAEKFAIDPNQMSKFRQTVAEKMPGKSAAEIQAAEMSALEYQEATGYDATTVFDAQRKLQQTYPEMSLKQTRSHIETMRQQGGINPSEYGDLMSELLPTTSAMGIPLADVEAIVAAAAQSGGKDSTLVKGERMILQKLPKLEKAGIVHHGKDLVGDIADIAQFAQSNPEGFDQEFGGAIGARSAQSLAALATHSEIFTRTRDAMLAAGNQDRITQEIAALRADPVAEAARQAHQHEVIQQVDRMRDAAKTPSGLQARMDNRTTAVAGRMLQAFGTDFGAKPLAWIAGGYEEGVSSIFNDGVPHPETGQLVQEGDRRRQKADAYGESPGGESTVRMLGQAAKEQAGAARDLRAALGDTKGRNMGTE